MRDVKHHKQPLHHDITRRFSYRIYDAEVVLNALTEQEIVRIQTSAAFRYGAQVNFQRFTSTEEAVEAAKQRAFSRFTTRVQGEQQTPTSRSEIVVNAGEGRSNKRIGVNMVA